MSALLDVLTGARPPGVYRWDAEASVDEVAAVVAPVDWRLVVVDRVAESKPDALAALGTALDFPDHYGRNLDALWDCLRDLRAPTLLLWETWGRFADADPAGFARVLTVLQARTEPAEGSPAPGRAELVVLLRGPGPEMGLPVLTDP